EVDMIRVAYVRTRAEYTRWQNDNQYGAADGLSDAQRKEARGAFFGSIHGTLNHLLWADQTWMTRLAGTPKPKVGSIPESVGMFESWEDLKRERQAFDQVIVDWAERLDQGWLDADLIWFSGAAGRELTKPKWLLVAHLFNHQTHHRGQVHCLLTQLGAKPGTTDLPFRS